MSFRLHGRSAETGLDCVGLAALAVDGAVVPDVYSLRMGDMARAEAWLRAAGAVRVPEGGVGDVALVRVHALQLHLMIRTEAGFVHAHAGLRRVVEVPGPAQWPVLGWWRIIKD